MAKGAAIFHPECKTTIKQKSISEKMLDWLQSRGQIGVLKLPHNNKQGVIWMIDSSWSMFVSRVLSLGRSVRTKNSKNDQKNFQNWSYEKSQKTKVVYFQKFLLEVQVSDLSGQKYANGTRGVKPISRMNRTLFMIWWTYLSSIYYLKNLRID